VELSFGSTEGKKEPVIAFVRSAFINMQNIISLYGTLRASPDSFECADTQRSLAALEMMMLEVLELVWALA
jgi:hypothetical protein